MSPAQRRLVVFAGVTSTLAQVWMLFDLRRLPAERLRGPKRAWVAASFVRPFGQLAYVLWGRVPASSPDGSDATAHRHDRP